MKPILQALVLADRIYVDGPTGKKVICGTFNRVLFKHDVPLAQEITDPDGTKRKVVPGGVHAGSPYLYISLTEIHGTATLELRFVDLQDNLAMLSTEFSIQSDDPLTTAEVVAPMPPLSFPHAGAYSIEVLCGGEPLGSLRIVAEELNL